ncbi:APC family permease [Cumulibacter manganitolerans]|uniref:APC family permease n=1 Tax=Cumulibacter manganitolerans TaxID=1884992 RepID=UPI0012973B17|nr:APC family permease [Cumulibacter manganitolerans]
MKEYALDEVEAQHEGHPGLHANTLSTFEMLAQSVAGIAPSAVMATGPALVALGAGDSVLYSYIASTIVMVLIGWCVAQFARREGEEATLLSYIQRALGPGAGFIGAVALAFGYLLIAIACLAGITMYLAPLLGWAGVDPESTTYQVILTVVVMVLAAVTMIIGVHLSTRFAMVLEVLSIIAITVVIIAVFVRHGISARPMTPSDLGLSGFTSGMVLAILGYVGFESAANLGVEARDPAHSVPRAVIGSATIVGVLYFVSAYAQLEGFGSGTAITQSAAPLNDLADNNGVGWMGYLVDVGAVASFFACITGSLNAASRLMFQIARDGFLPTSFGRAHRVRMTPHRSIIVLSSLAAIIALVLMISEPTVIDVFGVSGTIGTFGYMLAYVLMALGIIAYSARRGHAVMLPAIIGLVSAAALVFVVVKSIQGAVDPPYSYLHWIFLAVVLLSAVWYLVGRGRNGGGGGIRSAGPPPEQEKVPA